MEFNKNYKVDQRGSASLPENSPSKWVALVGNYKRALVYTLLGAALLLFFAYRASASSHERRQNDFLQAEVDAMQIGMGQREGAPALARLQEILNRRKELHQKYDGRLAQQLLYQEERAEGVRLAKQALARTEGDAPYYASFAETSLVLADGLYDEALTRALSLDAQLKAEEARALDEREQPFGYLLYLHNLLRIALLQQEIGNGSGEIAAWENLLQELQAVTPDAPLRDRARGHLFRAFRSGELTLFDYAKERLVCCQGSI